MADGAEWTLLGALPGDEVETFAGVRPPVLVTRAEGRRGIGCPQRACPGCPLSPLPYEEQLEAKRRLVARALEHSLGTVELPPVRPTLASPQTLGYRASAKLSVARGPKGPCIGIYRRGTHDVLDLHRCPVHHPLVAAGIRALRSLLSRAPGLVAPGPGAHGWLRYAAFQVSVAEGKLLVTLVTQDDRRGQILPALAARLAERLPRLSGVAWNINPTEGNEIFGEEWKRISGEDHVRERLGEITVRASAGSFLQVNREQAARAYAETLSWIDLGPCDRALDLYCGVGALSLHLAKRADSVLGLDASSRAIADARSSARDLGVTNAVFRQARVEEELPQLLREGFRPDAVTLNPARKGAGEAVIAALRSARPRAVVYLSCNPEALAIDAASLCSGGLYRLERIQPLDFFPHTAHVETLALLRRNDSAGG